MQDKIHTFIKWFLFISFLFIIFIHFYKTIEPVLFYQLQSPPFYFMKIFFNQYTDYPGGLSEYTGNLIAQLLHSNIWGSMLITLSIAFLMLCFKFIFSHVHGGKKGFFWMILPAFPAIMVFHNYYFPWYIFLKILFAIGGVVFFILLKKRIIILYPIFILLSISLYYIAGSTSLCIFLSSILIYSIFNKDFPAKTRLVFIISSLFIGFLLPYVGFKYFFNISSIKTWWDIVPNMPILIRYVPEKSLYILMSILPFTIFLSNILFFLKKYLISIPYIHRFYSYSIWTKPLMGLLFTFSVAVTTLIILLNIFPKVDWHKKHVIFTDYYASINDWEKVIATALNSSEYDFFVNINYNRATFNTNKIDWFFKYPQLLGSDGLFPDKIASGQIALRACEFYYELGYISEALHWAYEAQSITPYHPKVLQYLVKVNLIENKPEAAATYLNILSKTFFQKDFVEKYTHYIKDTSLISKDDEFKLKRTLMPLNRMTPGNVNEKFYLLLTSNSSNRRALEYLALHHLLSHKIGEFVKLAPLLTKYYPTLPLIYQEALLLYMTKTKTIIQYPFHEELVNKIKQFFEYQKNSSNPQQARVTLKSSYEGTYIYYLTYQSPVVTKMQLKAREVDSY